VRSPNVRVQRTRRRGLRRYGAAAELGRLGVRFAAAVLCIAGAIRSGAATDQWKARLELLRNSSIQIEKRTSPLVRGGEKNRGLGAISLGPGQIASVRNVLIAALRDNQESESKALSEGAVPAGVPGRASYGFRIAFRVRERTVTSWLHLGSGWLGGGPEIGNILLSERQVRRLQEILGPVNPC
jgi:hypothetical protein